MENGHITVTGATGFIGRHLVAHLIKHRIPATLLLRQAGACPTEWRRCPNLRLVEIGDIEISSQLPDILMGTQTLLHLAGLAHVKNADANKFFAANARATEQLVNAVSQSDVRKFVHLSSIAAVTSNASNSVIDDNTIPRPAGAYGESKREAEAQVARLALQGRFAVSIRPPLVVGSDAPANWRQLQKLAARSFVLPFAGVDNQRSYISVNCVVEMLMHLHGGNWQSGVSGEYCIAADGALSLSEVLTLLRRGMNKRRNLLYVPPKILDWMLRLAGQEKIANSLLGDLRISGTRFNETFQFHEFLGIKESIILSAMEFWKRENSFSGE